MSEKQTNKTTPIKSEFITLLRHPDVLTSFHQAFYEGLFLFVSKGLIKWLMIKLIK